MHGLTSSGQTNHGDETNKEFAETGKLKLET
jgi:hypothetical protein